MCKKFKLKMRSVALSEPTLPTKDNRYIKKIDKMYFNI